MSPPDVPGIPRLKLPSVREVDATSGAPHTPPPRAPQPSQEHIEVRSKWGSLNIPAVLIGSVVSALIARQTAPVVPPDDTLRRDVKDQGVEIRAQAQDTREARAEVKQLEQQVNAVRIEVSGLRADVARLAQAVEQMQKRP